jgi:hypothetical protein
MKHRWCFYRDATWMSPYWVGIQNVPLTQHEQKQSTALIATRGLESPMKSDTSPTQSDLNFKCKARHCKFDPHTLNFYVIVKFS